MVMLFADLPRAVRVVCLVLGLFAIGLARVNAEEETSPAVSDSVTQKAETATESEATHGESEASTEGEKAPEVAPGTAQPGVESSSKEHDTDPDDKRSRKRRLARAKGSAALAALIILGFAMVGLTWLGARVTRRYMFGPSGRPQPTKATQVREDDWAGKPLAKQQTPPPDSPQGDSSEP